MTINELENQEERNREECERCSKKEKEERKKSGWGKRESWEKRKRSKNYLIGIETVIGLDIMEGVGRTKRRNRWMMNEEGNNRWNKKNKKWWNKQIKRRMDRLSTWQAVWAAGYIKIYYF